jgi:hypothetical protein
MPSKRCFRTSSASGVPHSVDECVVERTYRGHDARTRLRDLMIAALCVALTTRAVLSDASLFRIANNEAPAKHLGY